MSCENSKCFHFAVQGKPTVQNRQFSSPIEKNKRWAIFDTMGYQRLLEYQVGLPLLKVNEPWKFKMLSFCISTGEYGPFSTMCFTQYWCKKNIWNFYGSLTLDKGKGIWYYGSFWYPIASNMTNFFHSFQKKEKLPVLDYRFHLYWGKMKTFGIFMAHWLWIKGNWLDILKAFGMPLCQIWLILSFCLGWEKK